MKLLICDDDISTIDVLQSQIDCQVLGISKIFRAYNGAVAMEIIAKEIPELILCDIEMPKNTGLEVLRFIYNEELPCELSFITSFESFEFAREAIKYGASRYLTKPLDFAEVHETLSDMARSYRRKNREPGMAEEDLVLNGIFRQIRDGYFGTNQSQIEAFLQRNNAKFTAQSRFHVIYILLDTEPAVTAGWERDVLNFSVSRVLEEKLTGHIGNAYTISERMGRFEKLTCLVDAQRESAGGLYTVCQDAVQVCRDFFSVSPVMMIDENTVLKELYTRSQDAEQKLYRMRLHPGMIFLASDSSDQSEEYPVIGEEPLIRALRAKDRAGFIRVITDFADRIAFEKKHGDRMMRHAHLRILEVCREYLSDNGISGVSFSEAPGIDDASQNAEYSTRDLVRLAEVCYDTVASLSENSVASTDAVYIVKDYIRHHYRDDINRDEVANIAYVTPNYLSKLFTQKIGMNMREYINLLRVNEAKRLLLTTDDNISDIASDLGYNNISYFSTVFRKICGMSPAEWRTGNEKED